MGQQNLLIGTSGYSYKQWRGAFYPGKMKDAEMLAFYAARFGAVEINNTFYRMPDEGMLARWAGEVPDQFAFTLKAPQRITHQKRLKDAGEDVAEFLRRAAVLGPKLGPLLFQLPPFFKKDLAVLGGFLEHLPPGRQIAFELRNPSWEDEAVYGMLRARGAMLCTADTDPVDWEQPGDVPVRVRAIREDGTTVVEGVITIYVSERKSA